MRSALCSVFAVVASVGILVGAPPAKARTVEYLQDIDAIRAAAADQGISGPFSNIPELEGTAIRLDNASAADHRVVVASLYCQAFHIDNPVSVLLQDFIGRAPQEKTFGTTGEPQRTVVLKVTSGSTVLRCMAKSDVEPICKNRVRITAEASFQRDDGSIATLPIISQVEREGRVGGFCGNIARYTGIVTREAAIELIKQVKNAM